MLTERSIINFLIWIAGLIIGPYLAYSILGGNPIPVLILVAAAFIFFMFAIAKDMLCIAPLVGLGIAGKVQFIPGRPDGFEFGSAAAILFYLITYTALKRQRVLTGPLYFLIPVVLITAIVLYHDPTASLRMEANGKEGGRSVVTVLLAALSYICCVSLDSPSARQFSLTPIFCIAASALSNIPYVVTTYVPTMSNVFYIFTDNINFGAYMEDVIGVGDEIVRNGGQAGIGSSIVIFLLCYFPVHTWWRPDRWWVTLVVLICAWFVVMGGFRSGFVTFLFTAGMTMWCHSSWRTLILVPPVVAVLAVAVGLQDSHLVHLPDAAQRTLSFLPGDWDSGPVQSAQSSIDFRNRIRTVYLREEAGRSPLFGNGLTYDSAEFARYNFLAQYYETPDFYYNTKSFLSGKEFHTGWISTYDAVGLVGSGAFLFFTVSLIWGSGKMIFGKTADRKSPLFPLKIWIFANLAGSFFGFLTVFGDFKTYFAYLCSVSIVWTHLNRLEKFGYIPPGSDRMTPFDPERAKLPVPA